MKTVGIVAEYNPFHNGHAYHLSQIKAQTGAQALVIAMSGSFVQRGEPALVNKWTRTEMALRGGADLVVELPFFYATQSAEGFAYGAVATFHAMGVVDALSFGVESKDSHWLLPFARLMEEEPEDLRIAIKQQLALGHSYPAAFSQALSSLEHDILQEIPSGESSLPNNLLALHYYRSLLRLKSNMVPIPIPRRGPEHHQEEIGMDTFASATSLRKLLSTENNLPKIRPYVPADTYELLWREKEAGRFPVQLETFYPFLLHQLFVKDAGELAEIHEMKEGIHHLVRKKGMEAHSYQELIQQLCSKRYTHSRIRRLLLYVLMNLTHQKVKEATKESFPPYLRVLGFSSKGKELLRKVKKNNPLPIVQQLKKDRHPLLELDLQASRLYSLGYASPMVQKKEMQRDFIQSPLQIL